MAFGSGELLLLAVLTWALVFWGIRDAMRRRNAGGWIAAFAVGIVLWPVAWVAAAGYAARRKQIA